MIGGFVDSLIHWLDDWVTDCNLTCSSHRYYYKAIFAAGDAGGHVFISYQWDCKQTVLKVRDRLRSAGYRVWIDEDDMCKSITVWSAFNYGSVVTKCHGFVSRSGGGVFCVTLLGTNLQWRARNYSPWDLVDQSPPLGSRGEAAVGGLGGQSSPKDVKQSADIVYRFWLQEWSEFRTIYPWLLTMQSFYGGG